MSRHRLRIVLQSEAAECGLACISMIAGYHGLNVSLAEIRRQFPLSLRGATLRTLISISHRLGLQSRAVRVELQDLSRIQLPCILHWNLDHFVVLESVQGPNLSIFDPAFGVRVVSLAEASDSFTGVVLELSPGSTFVAKKSAPSISPWQLAGRVTGLSRAIGQLLLLSLALQILALVAPFFLQWIIDQVLVLADNNLLKVLAIAFIFVHLMQVLVTMLRGMSIIQLSSQMSVQWVGNVFAHLIKLPLDFFEKRNLGDISSRLSSIHVIQRTLSTTFVEVLIDGVMALATLALMIVYSWKLSAITLVAVLLYFVTRFLAFRILRDSSEQQLVSAANQQTYLLETLRGMQSLKLGGVEALRSATYQNLIVRTVNSDIRLARLNLGFSGINQLIFGLERILVIWVGANLAIASVFSVGMLIAFLAYKEQFSSRVSSLIDKSIEFRMLRLHGERLAEIALSPPEEQAQAESVQPDSFDICVEDVSFRYAEDEPWVLRNCNLVIPHRSSVAIVGPSGCGKTTLMKVLLGLLEPTEGRILVGGRDIRQIGLQNYRTWTGAVMQDDKLFAGSIADNICFFDPAAHPSDIEAAAKLASVHEDVEAMPMRYGTLIGDMGSSLSGGQKQRIILARALFRAPGILMLDEATSHLDVPKERLVNVAIQSLRITRIIVAHRPETADSADRIVRMQNGAMLSPAVQKDLA